MMHHPSVVRTRVALHRRETLDFVNRNRLAALACDRPRRTGRRSKRPPRFANVAPMLLAALRPQPRPRFGSHA